MRQFNHPNVLSLTGVSVYDDVVCVVMPFMSNGDLKTYMRKKHEVNMLTTSLHISTLGANANWCACFLPLELFGT